MKKIKTLFVLVLLIAITFVACNSNAQKDIETNKSNTTKTTEEQTSKTSTTTTELETTTELYIPTTTKPLETTIFPTTTRKPISTTHNTVSTTKKVTTTTETQENKTPKPAKYTVILAKDFPNDFPQDGWSWHYSTYAWTPKSTSWGWNDELEPELEEIEWEVGHFSSTSNPNITSAPQTIENVKKFMGPPPTLEESKKLVPYDSDYFYIRYGEVNVYVCMEE